jgi:hypothetical protein
LCTLDEDTIVNSMARHMIRDADGYVENYAMMPPNATVDSEEENGVDHQEISEEE